MVRACNVPFWSVAVNTFLVHHSLSMKQTDPQYKLRLPQELKDQVEEAAKQSGRSMNAEIVARLESSFGNTSDASQLATLAAELAKAKRDSAYAAYISGRWLVDAVFLWDMLLQAMEVADAVGVPEILPKEDRVIAEEIGDRVDDEFKRQSKEFDPMALHEYAETSEAEFQKSLASVARLISNSPLPDKEQAARSSAIRERIKKRKRREFLPADAYSEAEVEAHKKL